jgi:DNA (cytosine-5)-methyltransferase 1
MMQIPVIDVFAGPGGLSEGFSSLKIGEKRIFSVKLSIEKDLHAHRTLELRSFLRQFDSPPQEYYQYLKKNIDRRALFETFPEAASRAQTEAWLAELGSDKTTADMVDIRIKAALGAEKDNWVLIGGPPCQAYSHAGRSKILAVELSKLLNGREPEELAPKELQEKREEAEKQFSKDKRHILYRHYLRVLARHAPPVFVMENVRGLLSSKCNGNRIFPRILRDLRHPSGVAHEYWPREQFESNRYRVYSLVTGKEPDETAERDYLIQSEDYGIPQARHRVILLGVRADITTYLGEGPLPSLGDHEGPDQVCCEDVLCQLPKLRSGVTRGKDSLVRWRREISNALRTEWLQDLDLGLRNTIQDAIKQIAEIDLPRSDSGRCKSFDDAFLQAWFSDPRLEVIPNHEARSHMPTDLRRYLFASCFAANKHRSPYIKDFPAALRPKHKNVARAMTGSNFPDRFRVQLMKSPASTVTSHISQDGHYYIHYDPVQCRSLTVREAARLQTFPDNYFFEGPVTQQYKQVGNAVPPLLARYIAEIVRQVLELCHGGTHKNVDPEERLTKRDG